MIKIFTPDDLLKYLYQDTTAEETLEIEKALQTDSCLKNKYEELQQDLEMLDELILSPSDQCTDHIMAYARAMNMKALVN